MSDVIKQNVLVDRCILDGEMLVWDASMNRFAEFGSNQDIAKIAKEGFDSDRQLCYVAFDILYVGDTSVIHQSLKERQERLRKVVLPIKGRLKILVPDCGFNDHRPSGEPCWSVTAYNADDVERFFKETVENRDEGIVLKDLGSKWEPGDRSEKWLKLKPEYVRAGSDLDVLIIGGYYGSGRRGGEVAQFLVGLAECSSPNTYPSRFISFCRVGTGLSDEELDAVITKLKPFFRRNEYPKKAPPSFYAVTNNAKEWPDVWIESPEKSIILSITSDIRTIRSEVFAAPYCLRYPRIDRVRYDKPWNECLDVQCEISTYRQSEISTYRQSEISTYSSSLVLPMYATMSIPFLLPTENLSKKSPWKNAACLFQTKVHLAFSRDQICGGKTSWRYYSLLLAPGLSFAEKAAPLQPKYLLFLSDSSRKKLQQELDENFDPYYSDLDIEDLKQLLSNINRSEDSRTINYYKEKFCPRDKWSCFRGCCIYLHPLPQALNSDSKVLVELAVRRIKHEISMDGGKLSKSLSQATHLVVISPVGFNLDFSTVLRSLSSSEVNVLRERSLHVVGSQWLEDCFDKEQRLQEESYSLKPASLEGSSSGEWKHDRSQGDLSCTDTVEQQNMSSRLTEDGKQRKAKASSRLFSSPQKDIETKRAGPTSKSRDKRKISVIQPRRSWGRPRKSARVRENESDVNVSSEKNAIAEESRMEIGDNRSKILEDTDPSKDAQAVNRQEVGEDSKRGAWVGKARGTESASGHKARDSEKLEVMVGPAQSMLINMIPSIGTEKIDCMDAAAEEGKPPDDNNGETVKKKRRVSYKDVAGELLRDG